MLNKINKVALENGLTVENLSETSDKFIKVSVTLRKPDEFGFILINGYKHDDKYIMDYHKSSWITSKLLKSFKSLGIKQGRQHKRKLK